MDYRLKLQYQSNYWYNDGLKKANIRDLSGAVTSLRRSLQYNRDNIAARNLLGLVYYGRGDVVEGLVEWILSQNIQKQDNIADYFIDRFQQRQDELKAINGAVKKYNQALALTRQGSDDLAVIQLRQALKEHPTYVRAFQLLTLIYLDQQEYGLAKRYIRAAYKLDKTDEITLHYLHELSQLAKENKKTKKPAAPPLKDDATVAYTVGNETIIQPVTSLYKERSSVYTLLHILLGLGIGVVVMLFLIMPSVVSDKQHELNQQIVSFSDQIATQKAQISALDKELAEYRQTGEDTEAAKATAADAQTSYEALMNVQTHLKAEDMSDADLLEQLLTVKADSLGAAGKQIYDEVTKELYPRMTEKLYGEAQTSFAAEDYDAAVTALAKVVAMDAGYSDGQAQLLLGQAYEKQGNKDKAKAAYEAVVKNKAGTEAAQTAQKALDGQQ